MNNPNSNKPYQNSSETRILGKQSSSNDIQSGGGGKPKSYRKPLLILLSIVLAGLLAMTAFIFAVMGGAFGEMPNAETLRAIKNPVSTEVFGADGGVLGKYYFENRSNVPYHKIHSSVINALIATEDARFFQHEGVDTRSLFRVLVKTILLGDDSAGGGSTISQQLIKNLFPRENHGILTMPVNKVREAIIASRLENVYSKEDIITLYLNTVSFGEDVFGIGSASQRFFAKAPDQLLPQESAVLIGMLKATTSYNPRRNPEKSRQRRDVVLSQMVKYGRLTAVEAEKLKKEPIVLKYNRDAAEGIANHFREKLRAELKQWCKDNPKPDGTLYNIHTDGLKIYTTIDSRMQRYAEEAVREHLGKLQKLFDEHWKNEKPWGKATDILQNARLQSERYKSMKAAGKSQLEIESAFRVPIPTKLFSWQGEIEKNISPNDSILYYLMFLNAGFVAMDPQSGAVKAYVGSGDYSKFKYDHVQAKRQVGSTFKPIVYANALENGVSPCQYFPNELRIYSDYQDWQPRNAEVDEYGGYYSLAGALAKSLNTISVQVLFDGGIENTVDLAHRLGISADIPNLPAIALGAADISLAEMVQAYCAFDNGGRTTPMFYLTAIKDSKGTTLATFNSVPANQRRPAMQEQTARMMTKIMTEVINNGTGRRLRSEYKLTNDIAGKTGTTQMQSDGWFIGYTPDLVCGAWVGGYDKRVRFRSIALGQGAATALPIWGGFMKRYYQDPAFKIQSYRTFVPPTPENELLMDCPPYADYPPDLYGNSTTTTDPTADAGTLDPNTDAAPSDATASDTAYEKPSEMYQPPVSPAGSEGRVITIPSSDGSAPKRVIVKPKAHRRTVTDDQTAQENKNDNEADKPNLIDRLKGIFGKQ
jgi:penicillin-binding protein 1A